MFRANLTRNGKFRKNRKEFKKIKKIHCGFISIQNKFKKAEKGGKQKLSFHFVPTRHVKKIFEKNRKKIPKI